MSPMTYRCVNNRQQRFSVWTLTYTKRPLNRHVEGNRFVRVETVNGTNFSG